MYDNVCFTMQAPRQGRRPEPRRVSGAHEPQSSKMKWPSLHKVFIVIVLFIQPCAY